MEPFDLLAYEEPTRMDRALGRKPSGNAYVELHNLIAAAHSIHEFGPESLVRIGRQYGVDLREAFLDERLALYARALVHALQNGDLDADDRARLAHLARTLYLSAGALRRIHEDAFGYTVSEALSDDCLSVEEQLLLYKLQHTLGIDPQEAGMVYEAEARARLLSTVARALCDGELSPEEADEIQSMERSLSVSVPDHVETMLDHAAHRWRLTHGPLQSISVDIKLHHDEVAYFKTWGRWREVNYARLRVLLSAHRERLTEGDTTDLSVPDGAFLGRKWFKGQFVVTNKRLLLVRNKTDAVKYGLRSLAGVERYRNGVRVSIKGNRSLLLDGKQDSRALHSVLARVLAAT